MSEINPYIRFDGNCRQAFEFYSQVFKTAYQNFGTFKELPPEYAVDEKHHHLIMHATLPIGDSTVLFGSDTSEEFGPPPTAGNNFSLSVSMDTEEEARRVFSELSEGGHVEMPMAPAFWGSLFGTLTDRFGIHWMVGYDYPQEDGDS